VKPALMVFGTSSKIAAKSQQIQPIYELAHVAYIHIY